MTATATPTPPNRADWTWPLKPPFPPPSPPPLELQFLPPSAAAATAASSESHSPPAPPWTVDPSRLQNLMMGSVVAPPPAAVSAPALLPPISMVGSVITAPAMAAPVLLSPISSPSPLVPDFAAFFDPGINKSLPSGWERCLDLKSGEVFIKKCDANAHMAGVSPAQFTHHFTQCHDQKQACARPSRPSEGPVQLDEQRLDWSLRWMQGKAATPTQNSTSNNFSFMKTDVRLHQADKRSGSADEQPLCLDLDLRLTSDNSSRLTTSEDADIACSRNSKPASSTQGSRDDASKTKVQAWTWQHLAHNSEKPTSIQEMVSESTMATAVCSKCLMYVLLKKSNPTCPRCFNPIILDCGVQPPAKKRPRLELSPDDLSLSTDSSR